MNNCVKDHYKDDEPVTTVERIKNKISVLGYSLTETWSEENAAGTYSLRLKLEVPGMDIGSNGKGSTREYARASAYGELCERLQNQLVSLCRAYATEENKCFIDESYMSLDEVLSMESCFMDVFREKLGLNIFPLEIQKTIVENLYRTNRILMRPFYSWKKQRIELVPWTLASIFYGSNGMSAGNTLEEAIVQGLSEIAERCVQREILQHPHALPNIPGEWYRDYLEEVKMKESLENYGYRVLLKDCSLGGKYPVAGLIVFREGDDHFGLKLGSHPDLEIAIERTFTEAFQGLSEEQFVDIGQLDMCNSQVGHYLNIYNTFKTPFGYYPWEIVGSDKAAAFQWISSCKTEKNNVSMMGEILHVFTEQGYDVLIREVSFLGFPSCQILVPGISELLPIDEKNIRAINTLKRSGELIKKPDELTQEEIQIINFNARYWKYSILENRMSVQYNLPNVPILPGNCHENGLLYLEMVTNFCLGKYQEAADSLEQWLKKEDRYEEDVTFEKVAYHYLRAKEFGREESLVKDVLSEMFDQVIVDKVFDIFSVPEKTMEKLYPRLDCPECGTCVYSGNCGMAEYRKLIEKLWEEQKKKRLDQNHITEYLNALRKRNHGIL